MYKISIINNVNGKTFESQFDSQEEAHIWRDSCIEKNSWGKPERTVYDPEDEPNPSQIISDNIELDFEGEQTRVVMLKCDYTITEEDLSLDANYITEQALAKRKEEYSKIDDLLKEALVEKELGDSTKWDAYIILREEIKTNNPL